MTATEVVSSSSAGFRKDFVVSDKATLSFSLDGARLFLGAAPPPDPEKSADEEIPADEKVLVDLWHWKDDYIQPIQKVRAEQERSRSYRAVYVVKDKRFVQLADEKMESVGCRTMAAPWERRPRFYRVTRLRSGLSDVYGFTSDAPAGRSRIEARFGATISPNAKYTLV
jgi:hypothetical protein